MKKNLFFLTVLLLILLGCASKKWQGQSMSVNDNVYEHLPFRQLSPEETRLYLQMLNRSGSFGVILFLPEILETFISPPSAFEPSDTLNDADFAQTLALPWQEFKLEEGIEPPTYDLSWSVHDAEAWIPDCADSVSAVSWKDGQPSPAPSQKNAQEGLSSVPKSCYDPTVICFKEAPDTDKTIVWEYNLPSEKLIMLRLIELDKGLVQLVWVTTGRFYWFITSQAEFPDRKLLDLSSECGGVYPFSNGKTVKIIFRNGDEIEWINY